MRFYQLLLSVALLNFSTSVKAFNARPLRSTRLAKATGPLKVGVALDWNEHDLDEAFLMQRAQVCANSDSCTLQDARTCLDDILHVQSGCVGGTILGSVCDNVDVAAELVAKLRNKIQEKTKEAIVVNTGVNLVAVYFTMMTMAVMASGLAATHVDSSPFTLQEIWWSIRDGYFLQLLSHYFRHGGLSTIDYDAEATAFSLQEWWWAMKGGYVSTMTEHYFKNGGLAAVEGFIPDATPFTPNEWYNALQDGYLDQAMLHNFKHAGLASVDSVDVDAIAATPQELFWAVRDGYGQDFVQHVFRKGGV